MYDIKKINPETAAHNIASILCSQYIKDLSISDSNVFNIDSIGPSNAAQNMACLYEIAYDTAYAKISKGNNES